VGGKGLRGCDWKFKEDGLSHLGHLSAPSPLYRLGLLYLHWIHPWIILVRVPPQPPFNNNSRNCSLAHVPLSFGEPLLIYFSTAPLASQRGFRTCSISHYAPAMCSISAQLVSLLFNLSAVHSALHSRDPNFAPCRPASLPIYRATILSVEYYKLLDR
jgi:hypothetical protein